MHIDTNPRFMNYLFPTRSTAVWLLSCVLAMVCLVGCDSSSDEGARVRILLTDAPGDIAEAYVTIDRVELVGDDEEDRGAFVLMDEPIRLNLIELQDGITETLGDRRVPVGAYSQIRLIVSETADVKLEDGTTFNLKAPSAAQSGIKVNVPDFDTENGGDIVEVVLDFNVERSFVKAGASGKYIFKPVVRAQSIAVNEIAEELIEVSGQIDAVDAGANSLTVEGVELALKPYTVIEDGTVSASDLAVDQFVDVVITKLEDGTLAAEQVNTQASDMPNVRSMRAMVDAVDAAALTLLGVEVGVDGETTYTDVAGLDEIEAESRVRVTYDLDANNGRVASNVDLETD